MAKMAGWCDSCFCFRDMQRGVVAVGIFSIMTSIIQILVSVAVFTGANQLMPLVFTMTKESITYELYIALAAMDFFIMIFAILFLYGNERTDVVKARNYFLPWIILIPFYVIYEAGVNIFFFYNYFNGLYMVPLAAHQAIGFAIVPLVYWVVKDILVIIGFIFLIVRYRSLTPQIERYVKQVSECRDCYSGPTLHAPVVIPDPAPCTACSGGSCVANRCGRCNLAQPMYGYAGGQPTANIGKTGWTTSIYSR